MFKFFGTEFGSGVAVGAGAVGLLMSLRHEGWGSVIEVCGAAIALVGGLVIHRTRKRAG